jgi:Na+-driven multidrug efflux pump
MSTFESSVSSDAARIITPFATNIITITITITITTTCVRSKYKCKNDYKQCQQKRSHPLTFESSVSSDAARIIAPFAT